MTWQKSNGIVSGKKASRDEKRIRLLGTVKCEPAVDDGERHAFDSDPPSLLVSFLNCIRSLIGILVNRRDMTS